MSSDSRTRGMRGTPGKLGQGFARIGRTFRRWDSGGRLTLLALLVVVVVGVGGALWGGVFADPDIQVHQLDAGPVSQFAIAEVIAYTEDNVYLVGLEDGRIRALDGLVEGSGCAVQWLPDDTRASVANPGGGAGAYLDPCSGAVWTKLGNAFSGTTEPLRTFQLDYETNDDGVQHVWVEVIGHREGRQ